MFNRTFAKKNYYNMKENTKDWFHYTGASALLVSAIVMGFASFFITMDIGPGPLAYIAESLSAALGLFGIGIYATKKADSISKRMDRRFEELESRVNKGGLYHETDDNQ